MSNAAQIATPILAIFGFWYTVLPLYSKAVLEEQVAKSQIDLESQKKQSSDLQKLINSQQLELSSLSKSIEDEKARSEKLKNDIYNLSEKRESAERLAEEESKIANENYRKMRSTAIKTALESSYVCLVQTFPWTQFYMAALRESMVDMNPSAMGERYNGLEKIVDCIGKHILDAYGIQLLNKSDTNNLKSFIEQYKPQLFSQLKTIDQKLSDERDAFLTYKKIEDEYGEKQISYFQSEENAKDMENNIASSVDATMSHLKNNRELGSEAQSAMKAYIQNIRERSRNHKWIE